MIAYHRGTQGNLSSIDYFMASGASGILTAFLTNPIWVIKTRMLSSAKQAPGAYQSVRQGTAHLWRTEGIPGFYRGLVPSLFGVSHGAIQFMAYEQLKNHWSVARGGKDHLTNLDFLTLSAVSKMFAGSITYPYQVVRARLQTYDATVKYRGTVDVIKQVWRNEGLKGFYKGYVTTAGHALPHVANIPSDSVQISSELSPPRASPFWSTRTQSSTYLVSFRRNKPQRQQTYDTGQVHGTRYRYSSAIPRVAMEEL